MVAVSPGETIALCKNHFVKHDFDIPGYIHKTQ